MARRKHPNQPSTVKSERFFQKELAGEEPPSLPTIETIYALAVDFSERIPWSLLGEEELVLVQAPASEEICFCSVMGALGEVMSLRVYLGAEGYRFFRRLQGGEPMTIGGFFGLQRSVYVEFVRLGELTAPDRELLRAMGHPLKRGTLAPIFRSIRPGYHAWYVTENEAQILAECQRAAIAVCDLVQASPDVTFWDQEGVYPLLSRETEKDREYHIRLVEAPVLTAPMPKLPTLDEGRTRRLRDRRFPSRGVLEVDHFYSAGMIGARNERKACGRLALAIDAHSGLVYPPEVSSPESSTGDVLTSVVLGAIESGHALPLELHVRDREFKILLEPLAQALGFPVKVTKSLPALDDAKSRLLEMMGEPGPLPARRGRPARK